MPRTRRGVVETVVIEEVIEGDEGDEDEYEDVEEGGAMIEELGEAESAVAKADREGVAVGPDGEPEEPVSADEDEDVDDFDPATETLSERLYALRDIVPIYRRRQVQHGLGRIAALGKTAFSFSGAAAWIVATSILVTVLPLGIEAEFEQQAVSWENEMRAQQEQAQQVGSLWSALERSRVCSGWCRSQGSETAAAGAWFAFGAGGEPERQRVVSVASQLTWARMASGRTRRSWIVS